VAAAAAVGGGSNAGAAAAPVKAPDRFTRVPAGTTVNHKPLALSTQQTTVVVQMAGDPVTVADANAATPLTKSQRQQRKEQLRQQQTPALQRVRDLGGTVLGSYQSSYNGFKVRIAANRTPALLDIPNVVGVHKVFPMKPDNVKGVPLIGAPAVWGGVNGFHGEGIKIAVIDTGIDWTHANFGGAGTPEAYDAAHAAETAPADPAFFGPAALKVKGGIDLVGDSYNADSSDPNFQPVPHPDPNPLDCNGHGSHVAGTATGFGVLANGSRYTGPYNATTVSGNSWLVGPGVAPKADLYGVRVFGCAGSTDVVVDAIEWAVDNDMDVINMSLGSPFGSADDPSAVASTNAARAGVIVVTSAGNSGPAPYITGAPGTGTGVISTAASDPTASNPGARLAISGGPTIDSINANGATFSDGTTLPIKVLKNGSAISLGCNPAEYAGSTGMLVVTARGTCARVARAVFGQQAGAAAVLMVNNVNALPPFEGPITGNPDTGEQFNVTIPFLGVPSSAGAAFLAADGGSLSMTNFTIPNPGFLAPASFTSGGPRTGDSWLKPEVTAPGVSIFSTGIGTGNGMAVISGTSMASPHNAGLAALVKQAHPNWRRVQYWKAAIVNTADPAKVNGYSTRIAGTGLIQAEGATQTQVVALGDPGTAALNFGYAELSRNFSEDKTITLRNFSNSSARFNVAVTLPAGRPHTTSLNRSSVTVPARGEATVRLTLNVPSATAGNSASFQDVAGLVSFTPVSGANGGVGLKVPYYLVPDATSNIETRINTRQLAQVGQTTATITNRNGATTGFADWYAWGLSDSRDRGLGSSDVRAVGAQAFPGVIALGVSTERRWSNASTNEFDIFVDVNLDGTDDYVLVGADLGLLTAGAFNGQMASAVIDLRTGAGSIEFLADAPMDSTTLALPALIEQFCAAGSPCLSAANPRFRYHAVSFDLLDNSVDEVDGVASFNAFTPSLSTGMFNEVAPNAAVGQTVTLDAAEFAQTPALGLMIFSHDNRANTEAQLVSVRLS